MRDSFSVGECIEFGWTTFKERPAAYVVTAFVLLVANAAAQSVAVRLRGVGIALATLLAPMYWICSVSVARRGASGEEPTLSDAFRPFTERQGDYLLVALAMASGVILCGVGTVVTWFLCTFSGLLVLEGRDFKAAVIESKDLVLKYPSEVVLLLLACFALNVVGALAFGIGMLVSGPVTTLAVVRAYRQLTTPGLLPASEAPT